jgi:carbon-monoxide dehydrogenase medium subunit
MIPALFDYVAPSTLDDAIAQLVAHNGEAKILSGGQSLIPMLKLRLATTPLLVDINRVPGLAYLEERDDTLRIGALTRDAALDHSALVKGRYALLADTAGYIADPIVRNTATVCGNLAHGDPGNDHPAAMLACDATFIARGPAGTREIPARQFFVGLFTTALAPDEILVEVRVPAPQARSGGAYLKLERKVGDYATAAVAVQLTLDAGGACTSIGIGLTNVGPTAIEARRAATFLLHKPLDAETMAQGARIAAEEAQPTADRKGSEDYKRDMIRILCQRALRRAVDRANGIPVSSAHTGIFPAVLESSRRN